MKFLINANLGCASYSSHVPSLALEEEKEEEEGNFVIFLPPANWNTDKMLELKHSYYLPKRHGLVEQGEERASVLWVIDNPGDCLKIERLPVYDAIILRLVLPAAKFQPNQDEKLKLECP